ncbi:hypothetical protein BDZ94DRAFT_1163316, partial [Collybia nuda]
MKHFFNLGKIYDHSYEITNNQQDLENAIIFYKGGLDSCTDDIQDYLWLLNNLGLALREKYMQLGNLDHLEEAVAYHSKALKLCSPGRPDRPVYLNSMGSTWLTRYKHLGHTEDLEKAIACHEQALDLRPPGHPDRSISLNNLANALQARYQQLGEVNDLDNTIACHEQALDLCPSGHPRRSFSLNNLATALQARYGLLGGSKDLDKAITCHREALDLRPSGHSNKPSSLNNLAGTLDARYKQLGEMQDLEEAIACQEQALDLCPPGHHYKSMTLNNLAGALQTRHEQLGEIQDLEKAITCHEQVLELRPLGHPAGASALTNFAKILQTRYTQLEEVRDLERAIAYNEQALELCPPGHPLRPSSLNNLAGALQTRYGQLGEIQDLEKAITYLEWGLASGPSNHPFKVIILNNLGIALQTRYKQIGELEGLEKAISYHKEAFDLCPSGHPNRALSLNSLGHAFFDRYNTLRNEEYLKKSINYHEEAACTFSSLPDRLEGAKQWAIKSHKYNLNSPISAYSLALDLLQQHLALLPSLKSQQKLIEGSSHLSLDAAACAISIGNPKLAVQLLEQGRSILWSKIQGYRQPFLDLSEDSPHLFNEFQYISKQLESNATSNNTDFTFQRTLSERWVALLQEIRNLDGFQNYLKRTPFDNLKDVSVEGPVIMVNISNFRSDAIILVSGGTPMPVPLHGASPQLLKELVEQLSQAITTSNPTKTTYHVLRQLWEIIIKPVVVQLEQLKVPEKSHIWWCPTSYLCALPLHAAGPYKKGFKSLPDLYISSYTPTLESLIRARSDIIKPPVLALLLVSQPDDTIPQVFEEAQVINNLKVKVNSCSGQSADKQAVLESLQSHSWVHFACHGHVEAQPFDSWFQL